MVGGNPYTEELLQLEQCAPMVARPVAPQLAVIKTPFRVRAWERALVQHPDGEFVKFVLRGIAGGFRIGFNYQRFSCKPARSNMKSCVKLHQALSRFSVLQVTESWRGPGRPFLFAKNVFYEHKRMVTMNMGAQLVIL